MFFVSPEVERCVNLCLRGVKQRIVSSQNYSVVRWSEVPFVNFQVERGGFCRPGSQDQALDLFVSDVANTRLFSFLLDGDQGTLLCASAKGQDRFGVIWLRRHQEESAGGRFGWRSMFITDGVARMPLAGWLIS